MCIAIQVNRSCCWASDRESSILLSLREAGRLEEARDGYAGAAKLAPEVWLYAMLATAAGTGRLPPSRARLLRPRPPALDQARPNTGDCWSYCLPFAVNSGGVNRADVLKD